MINQYSERLKKVWDTDDNDTNKEYRQKAKSMLSYDDLTRSINPFLDKNGNVFNKYMDYQKMLDNPNIGKKAKEFITQATGLSPTPTVTPNTVQSDVSSQNDGMSYEAYTKNSNVKSVFNPQIDENSLGSLDVTTELPKLDTEQISQIISKHFSNSSVIKPTDAEGIYNAQQQSGMSALAILGIGALESGYGTSNIAKQKNNIWGWNATNVNPYGNAKSFSQMSQGASEFANAYLNTYYNGYGAKSIYSAGTGNNPKGKGYAYNNDGSINTKWASDVDSIMRKFYQTAKGAYTSSGQVSAPNGSVSNLKVGKKIADTSKYNNSAVKGQCVWYARGRASEKLGKNVGSLGNANEMWYNAKPEAKLQATAQNIKPNIMVSYKTGTSSAGAKYGHVIFVEDVVGDTVYYTEGGSAYHKNGTDGVVKTTTRSGLLNGINSNGNRIGGQVIGFIDLSKY